jgi:hypothetical protein
MRLFTLAARVTTVFGLMLGITAQSALAQPPGRQTDGMVVGVDGNVIALMNGASFPITDATRVTRVASGSIADLAPGKLVSISARSGPGGALEAFLVYTFAEGSTPSEGQREMTEVRFCQPGCAERDLMTNAMIADARLDAVSLGELTISFAGQTGTVLLSPDTRIELQSAGSLADIAPGTNVLGFINDEGAASGVWVYMD